jgi:hypothetical protein
MQIRTVHVNKKNYLFIDDVISLILELGSTEPTDTRDRMEEMARNLKDAYARPTETTI